MTLVLLNDVNDSYMLHLFFEHMCAIMEFDDLQKLTNLVQRRNKRPRAVFISIGSEKEDEE